MINAIQLGLFPAKDERIEAFMMAFGELRFGKPNPPNCQCQACRYSRLVDGVRDGSITAEMFRPYFEHFTSLDVCYVPPGNKWVHDCFGRLAILGYDFSKEGTR